MGKGNNDVHILVALLQYGSPYAQMMAEEKLFELAGAENGEWPAAKDAPAESVPAVV